MTAANLRGQHTGARGGESSPSGPQARPADSPAASEQGEGEDLGPLDPETVEKLRERGIEQPDWTPGSPAA